MHNKKNNKGFSLVELIVVVAIMAVLVGVLAPAYLKYVENSRIQKDVSAVGEVVQSIKIAAANEEVSKQVSAGVTIYVKDGSAPNTVAGGTGTTAIDKELASSIGKVDFSAKDLDSQTVTIGVTSGSNGELKISVSGGSNDVATKLSALSEN